MHRVVIHIGMHKTGSSSIQSTLSTGLDDPRFRYLRLGAPNHSEPVYSLFADHPGDYFIHRARGRDAPAVERFNASVRKRLTGQLGRSRPVTHLVSGEDIALLSESGLVRLREFLARFSREIRVVAYVRPPVSFLQSAFQQRVKGPAGELDLEGGWPEYRARFEKFDRVFGKENVLLWKFEPARFRGGNVVLDFCDRLGIRMRSEAVRRFNDSLSKEALSLLYVYRKLGPGYGSGTRAVRENLHLIDALRAIGKERVRFAPELTQPILDAHRDDIRWMESRLGEPLDETAGRTDGDIRSLEELMEPGPAALAAVSRRLGRSTVPGSSPQEVAELVHALRRKAGADWRHRWRRYLDLRLGPGFRLFRTPPRPQA